MPRGRPRGSRNRAKEDGNGVAAPAVAALPNGAVRAKIIREVCEELDNLDAERKAIGAQMREIQQKRIKGDLGMKIADFAAARRLATLEDDDRSTYIDAVRETFAALGVGAQGSFFAAFEPPPLPRPQTATTASQRADAMEQARQHLYGGGESEEEEDADLAMPPGYDDSDFNEDELPPAA